MVKRLVVGLVKGALLSALLIGGLGFGLHLATLAPWFAYIVMVAMGALTGLVVGKPVWQAEAGIEGGLKALFGMGLAALGLYLVNRFIPYPEMLKTVIPNASQDGVLTGSVSLFALPTVTVILSLLFELDNTPLPPEEQKAKDGDKAEQGGKVRVPGALGAKKQDADDILAGLEDELPEEQGAKKKTGRR